LTTTANKALPATIASATGFAANLAQVSLFRFFMGVFYGTEMHLGIFLAIWLAGISLGGYVSGKKSPGLGILLNLILLTSLTAILIIYVAPGFLPESSGSFQPFMPVVILMSLCVFPVSFTNGMLLPSLIKLSQQSLGIYYSYEAMGGFAGGIFFSLLLGGTASPVLCLMCVLIVIVSASLLLKPGYLKALFLVLVLVPGIYYTGPSLIERIEANYWLLTSKSLVLQKTVETPYQKLQLCAYHEQMSLFSNGMFSDSWPVVEAAEQRVHPFVTALKNYDEVLVLGAPPPDVIKEFLKYSGLSLSIVELDQQVTQLFSYSENIRSPISLIHEDPRSFLNQTRQKFDGILIYPVSPVTLAGNRLFTIEAFKAMHGCLKPEGVLSLQVSGSENYLGTIKEQIILSTWQGLGKIFPQRFAIPGSTITFFACQSSKVIPEGVKGFMQRFAGRKINTATFLPMSFYNLLMPFRVKELEQWLSRSTKAKLNTDAHPESFAQQLELWNIYSGASVNSLLDWLQQRTFKQLVFAALIAGLLFLPFTLLLSRHSALKVTVATGVCISGATGLLSEIILILLYQNSNGAAYQMSAFFFGVYMLGLASGAWLFGRITSKRPAIKRLQRVKILQVVFALLCVGFVDLTGFHSAILIAGAIFIIAFLDGIEFPVADSLFRKIGAQANRSAGTLLFADNLGALGAGIASGLWLLPTIGMKNSFFLLAILLAGNLLILLLIKKDGGDL
jgi:predicted membrane-bound spermidine synthase